MHKWIVVLLAAFAAMACTDEGPAERAGAALDAAADDIGDAARDVRDETADFAEDVADSIESARQ